MDKKIQRFTRICLQADNPHECKGTWSEKQPCCIPRSCPDPNNSNFRNGSIEGNAYFYPETIFLNCSEGHEIVGARSYFQCNQSGQWHEISKPSDEAAQQANERINSEREKVKSCIWPKSNSIKTRHFPTNIRQFPTCQPKDCRKPVIDSNCTLVSTSFHYPSTVMFDRTDGYCVVGSTSSQCNSQGLWSNASPTCERIYCPQMKYNATEMWVTIKRNGQAKDCLKYKFCYGHTVTFDPRPGYSLDRSVQLVCEQYKSSPHQCAGYWYPDDRLPQPFEKICPPPPVKINNGLVQGSDSTVGSTISFTCSADYELKDGSNTRICLSSGQWSGMQPRCEHVCAKYVAQPGSVQYCTATSGKAELVCPGITECPSDLTPVCSSDTQTYDNLCLLKIYGCRKYGVNDTTTAVANDNCLFGGICTEPQPKPSPGDQCRQTAYRYFYNTETSECEWYANGPCYKGHNSFYTLDDCKDHCETSNPCISKMDPGLCNLHQLRYYYNLTEEKCMEFNYSGCYGNENNFISESTCEAKCSGVRITPTPVMMTAAVSCGRPPLLLNGKYEGHFFSYGAMVRYHCNVGYCLAGNNTSICLKEGHWHSNTHRKCQILKCPNLQSISNGSVSVSSNYLGGTATYRCKTGFDLIGSRTTSCQKHSPAHCSLTWTEHPPTCRGKDCGDPGDISRGRIAVIQGDGRRYPSYIQFICNLGYQIVEGTEFMTCSSSQVWKGKRPKCQPVYCGELKQPKNGEIIVNKFYFGESATFSCNRGYMMIGKKTSTCVASGTWTNTSPKCIETRCFPIQRQKHGRVVGTGNQIGSVLVFQCTLGYALKGPSKLHCVQTKNLPAKWNMPIPECQAMRCEPLQPPENGFISGKSNTFPNYVVYACKEGYRLIGTSKRSCNASGQWKGLAPNCQRISCPPIQNPLNGELVSNNFSINSTVEFICNAGYAVRGSYTSTCMVQGIWSSEPPTCQRIKCASLPRPKFGKVVVSQTHVRSVARYSCIFGYRLVGVTHRQCTQTSQFTVEAMWSPKSPKCIPVRCSTLHAPLNGKIVGSKFYYPHFVLYLCDYGYQILSGNSTRKCNEIGKWTGIAPLCKGVCEVAKLNCSNAQICAVDSDGSATCVCKSQSACPLDVRPVCGSDGRTYINECLLEVEACLFGSDLLRSISQGACEFSCHVCHSNADCVENTNCSCKPRFVGDGRKCCFEELTNQVALLGSAAWFDCQESCDLPFGSTQWYLNGQLLDHLDTKSRFAVSINERGLAITKLKLEDIGEYTCKVSSDRITYERHGHLDVIDPSNQFSAISQCSSDCGKSCARKPFVAGGDTTSPGEFPWQAMLCSPRLGQHCGGVLISDRCVLTAAHCLKYQSINRKTITVCLGKHCGNCSESDSLSNSVCSNSSSIIIHPNFNQSSFDHDIAVLKLARPVNCNCRTIMPVCLPDKTRDSSFIRAQQNGIVTGWGRVNSTVSRSRCLRKGDVRLKSRRLCQIKHQGYQITENMLCATDYNGACEGDSGGPLVVKNRKFKGRYVLAGVVSWGIGCGDKTKFGVYTNVISHLDWIKSTCGIN
ncbi:sushi, von Willebrand factor type A, EGF and pentraxin domain-containing protein 1-like [Corticium candelabrum]|uniref:sushi, von Willebrand factor type A, EGF and pentraxin domain-containing protein 1-like n=1 Tax=Corticium candelabrum TaxID=121492 RepID=UPI002E256158|nr:sushi, von Willebrand factor type A, EGF and pentraxin domain-containing protein 1-like [Corticium candelabrum]